MREILEIGAVPSGEPCSQIGEPKYNRRSKLECIAFIAQLVRVHGEPPAGAYLITRANSHEFGTYHEVAVRFDDDNLEATRYAFKLEAETPEHWDDEAKAFLASQNY